MWMHRFQHHDKLMDGFKTIQNGVLLFGALLVTLGILVIAFPARVAFMVAFSLLLAGSLAVTMGYKIWRLRKNPGTLGFRSPMAPVVTGWRVESGPRFQSRTLFILR